MTALSQTKQGLDGSGSYRDVERSVAKCGLSGK